MDLIRKPQVFEDFKELETIRKQLKQDTRLLEINDLGAGSKKLGSGRRINQITKYGIAPKKQAEFFYKLVHKFKPETIIELGTSVGLTSLYLAKANPQTILYTIEGAGKLVEFSTGLFKRHSAHNIVSIQGNFDEKLPELLGKIDKADMVYFDGNHAYEPTLRYFEMALTKKHSNSIFIFDDINWSDGMQKVWKQIYSHPEVTVSLDFFFFGIVFFRNESKNKEHFVLKY